MNEEREHERANESDNERAQGVDIVSLDSSSSILFEFNVGLFARLWRQQTLVSHECTHLETVRIFCNPFTWLMTMVSPSMNHRSAKLSGGMRANLSRYAQLNLNNISPPSFGIISQRIFSLSRPPPCTMSYTEISRRRIGWLHLHTQGLIGQPTVRSTLTCFRYTSAGRDPRTCQRVEYPVHDCRHDCNMVGDSRDWTTDDTSCHDLLDNIRVCFNPACLGV